MDEIIVRLDKMQEKLDTIMKIIIGDPTDSSKPGVHLRLDRLEQSNKLKNRVISLLAMGVFTSLGSAMLLAISKFI